MGAAPQDLKRFFHKNPQGVLRQYGAEKATRKTYSDTLTELQRLCNKVARVILRFF